MATTETENGAAAMAEQYEPFTPFQEGYAFEAEPSALSLLEHSEAPLPATPFASEYQGEEGEDGESLELRELLFELYDQEFDETLEALSSEMWEALNERAEPFGETESGPSAEQFLQEWSAPVREAAETMLENIAEAASELDAASLTEAEVDQLFERFEPRETGLEAHFEDFLGGLWKKAKTFTVNAVGSLGKGIVQAAGQGLSMLPGIGGLLKQLKGLVRPLIERVLRGAVNRLPTTLRPAAKQLAQRMLGLRLEVEEAQLEAAPAAADVGALQREFDLEAGALLFAPDEVSREVVLSEALTSGEEEGEGSVAELQEARARFVDDLEKGVDPAQAMEQFLPAVMALLPIARTVIRVIGRDRVRDFFVNACAAAISNYIDPAQAKKLSRALVDTSMRMVSLEASEGEVESEAGDPRVAYEAIAQTLEDTMRRLGELDETAFEDETVLEASVAEAFREAAAENFPPQLIVPELHEAPLRATWALMPRRRQPKYYKKYTHVFDVELTPQVANSVTTFGGKKLGAVLRQQLGVTLPVRAKVHIYQAIAGTTLPRIARLERGVPGMSGKHGKVQLHPLTRQAAGVLLHHPRLGRDVPGAFRSSRRAIAIGQRFYFLQISGAKPITVPTRSGGTRVRRPSDVNITLDFPRDEFRVFLYLSEADSQEIAAKIRKRDLTSVLILSKRVYDSGVRVALSGDIQRHVKILMEQMPQEQFLGSVLAKVADAVKQQLARKIVDWVTKAIADYMKAAGGEFVAATESPADGVSIVIRLKSPPGAPLLRKVLRGEGIGIGAMADLGSVFRGVPQLSVKTVPGFRHD
ncbi:MAG TPA: hypothetical protein VFU16_07050 [Solirubrobacterales bacterium]|nr:hypothetical protein [Solirubrobacterales bacterium]